MDSLRKSKNCYSVVSHMQRNLKLGPAKVYMENIKRHAAPNEASQNGISERQHQQMTT